MKHILLILIYFLVPVIMVSGQEQQAQKLLSEAIYQEEVKGDLDNAIKTYQLILSKYPDNRKVSAEVLLHLGMCYEKLGNQEAVKTYKRLVNSFPEQKNQVAVARERLTRLMQAAEKVMATSPTPKFTKIKMPTNPGNGLLSPDGKRIAFIFDGCVWTIPVSGGVDPLIAGEPKKLTDNIGAWDMSNSFAWSGDGKWIAVNAELKSSSTSIYVIPSEGGKPHKVQVPSHSCNWPTEFRLSLSPDGKILAYTTGSKTGDYQTKSTQIYTIPVNGGTPKELTGPGTQEPAFSPDGTKIAYIKFTKTNEVVDHSDLWVIPSDGGTPVQVTSLQSLQVFGPSWSPDGKMIAFIRRAGIGDPKEIWIVPVTNKGNPSAPPTKVDLPLASYQEVAGWTSDNKIGLQLMNPEYEIIYTVNSSGGIATQVTPQGWTEYPKWSPDGKKIFFRGDRGKIAFVPSGGGAIDSIPIQSDFEMFTAAPGSGNDISPDGKTIVFSGARYFYKDGEKKWDVNIYTIPVEGGKPKQLTSIAAELQDRFPCWSPDGDSIAFIRPEIKNGKHIMHIFTISKEGDNLRQITTEADSVAWAPVDWAPDGKSIAFFSIDNSIRFIPAEGGESQFLIKVDSANSQFELAWSPDGKELAYTDNGKIWIYTNESGKSKEIKTGVTGHATKLGWSPDGKKIAFTAYAGGDNELWLMENFLPLEKLAQNNEKENLAEPEGLKIRQIWRSPLLDDLGTVSYDGQFRSYVDWGVGDVAIQNLITGEKKKLTDKASLGDTVYFALGTAISKDGKTIASSWWKPHNTTDLVLVDVKNPSLNILYHQKGEEVYPATWLSNNELVATREFPDKRTLQIISLNILNKSVQVKKTFEKMYNPRLACSSDQKYIAYDFANDADKGNTDINLLLADGDGDIPLIKHPANDRVLGWVPGRKEFLFISDRSGSWDLWAITLDNGKPSGSAKRIYTDIGEVTPMGFTQNGNCYFGFVRRNFNTYIVPFNSETGELKEGSGKSLIGSNIWIKWSPDGQYLAYIKENAKADNPWQLTIQDLKTGEERKIANNLLYARMPCWSPDGNSILVQGTEKNKYGVENYKGGIFLVDVKTGQTSEILLLSDQKYTLPEDDSSPLSDIQWSSDGKSIFYLLFKDRLVKRDLATGKEKILYENPNFERLVLNCSPDGKWLLFGVMDPAKKKNRLLTMSVEGGEVKELCTLQEAVKRQAKWSPDGKYIYFTEISDGTSLWRIPAEGGTPQKIWHSKNDTDLFSIRPDGKEIALGIQERTTEMRVIENLVQELEKLDKTPK
jgi:Tol biopolymer transport system component